MATATGAQLLVRMLKPEGVRHLFTLSGLHIAPIYAACIEEGIQLVDTRHEQAAAHAADATARLTRGIGVCAVTAGPGVTDALTGIANAFAATQLAAFAEHAGAPVFLNGAGRGSLPADHPHFFSQTRKDALAEADVVVIVGTPLDFRLGYGAGIAETARIVQIDSDGAEIGRNRAVDLGIVGDSRTVLEQLTAATSKRRAGGSWLRGL